MDLFGQELELNGNIEAWLSGKQGTFGTLPVPISVWKSPVETGTPLEVMPVGQKPLMSLPFLSGEDKICDGTGLRTGRCDFTLKLNFKWSVSCSTWAAAGSLDEIMRYVALEARKISNLSCECLSCWASVLEVLFSRIGPHRTCSFVWKLAEHDNIRITQTFDKEVFEVVAGLFFGICEYRDEELVFKTNSSIVLTCSELIAVKLGFLPNRQLHGPDDFPKPACEMAEIVRRKAFTLTGHSRWICIEKDEAMCESRDAMLECLEYAARVRGINNVALRGFSLRTNNEIEPCCKDVQSLIAMGTKPLAVGILVMFELNSEFWDIVKRKILQYASIVIVNGTGTRGKITRNLRTWPANNFPPYAVTYLNTRLTRDRVDSLSTKTLLLTLKAMKETLHVPGKCFVNDEEAKTVLIVCADTDLCLQPTPSTKQFLSQCTTIVCTNGKGLLGHACGFLRYFNNPARIQVFL